MPAMVSVLHCSMVSHNFLLPPPTGLALSRRADDLTLVAMRKPGAQLTWDDVNWKDGPDYHMVPQCALLSFALRCAFRCRHCHR